MSKTFSELSGKPSDASGPTTLALLMPEPLSAFYGPRLAELLPDIQVADGNEAEASEAQFVLAISPTPGRLATLPSLRCVIAPGAGVDHILADDAYPRHVPLARMVQPDLLQRMLEYVVLHVLRHHRRTLDYEAQQRAAAWRVLWPQKAATERCVGILGLGELGHPIARTIAGLGFEVRGWSRTAKAIEGVSTFAGPATLPTFLSGAEILVNLLPATPETRHLLDAGRLAMLPRGAAIINAGRGSTMVQADLLKALESGHIDSATLDVFETEPLPPADPLWSHPRVTITPHVASAVTPEAMAQGVRAVVDAVLAGRSPPQEIDLGRGY